MIVRPRLYGAWNSVGRGTFRVNTTSRTITTSTLWLTPESLAAHIVSHVDAVLGTVAGGLRPDGRLWLAADASWQLQNGTVNNALPSLGFPSWPVASTNDAAKYGAGTPHGLEATRPLAFLWSPGVPPKYDSLHESERPNTTVSRSLGGQTLRVDEATLYGRNWKWEYLAGDRVFERLAAPAGKRSAEEFLEGASRFRFWPDETNLSEWDDYVLSHETVGEFAPSRQFSGIALYTLDMSAWRHVP